MKSLRYWWRAPLPKKMIAGYQAMSVREQLLTRLTLNLLLVAVVVLLLAQPLWHSIGRQWQEQQEQKAANQQLQSELQLLQQQQLQDPNQSLRDELAQLSARQTLLDERIARLTSALVSPAQMTALLEPVLAQQQGLQPVSLVSLPARRVELGDGYEDVQLFRHSLQVSMRGSYQGVVSYLRSLDQLPWVIGWEQLTFDVSRYPQGDLTFQVSTLSRQQEVVGGE